MKPLLLDTFCKAGGTSVGYHRAGFEVVGVDIEHQKRYPFEFHQDDAVEFIKKHGGDFDVISASPPCQDYTPLKNLHKKNYPRLISVTRKALQQSGKPYIIENVTGARFELDNPIMLCGTMFDLRVIRHRYFECNPVIWWPPIKCAHVGRASGNKKYKGKPRDLDHWEYLTITGHDFRVNDAKIAMGIDWMIGDELREAIPPAYTEWIGKKMREMLNI